MALLILSMNGMKTLCFEKEYPIAKATQNRTIIISVLALARKNPFDTPRILQKGSH
jgi:hypothetical protein